MSRDQAKESKSTVPPNNQGSFKGSCLKCRRYGHRAVDCPAPKTSELSRSVNLIYGEPAEVNAIGERPQTKEQWEAALPKAKEALGTCPICSQYHTYERKVDHGKMDWPSSQLKSCSAFRKLKPIERIKKLESLGGCPKCTS